MAGLPGTNPDVNPDTRPALAYVVHLLYPFRLHVQHQIAKELPELHLHTLVTWDQRQHQWTFAEDPAIGLRFMPDGPTEQEFSGWRGKLKDWHAGAHLINWFKEHKPAAVVMCGYAFPAHRRAIRWLKRNGVPYMLWSDSNHLDDTATGLKRFLKDKLVRPVVRDASAILVCGTNGSKYYARYGATPDKTFLCPVVPDCSLIENCPVERVADVRTRFGLSPQRRRFMHCARLIPLKSTDNLVRAFIEIAPQRPDWDLVIVGDGPLRPVAESLVPASLKSRVIFTGFTTDQATTAAIERTCDVLVHPGYSEAWGVVLLEAAAAGMAIIASDVVGAASDFVFEGVNGFQVPPRDVPRLAAAMLKVSGDEASLARMKNESRRISLEFRQRADPVNGLRQALARAEVLKRT